MVRRKGEKPVVKLLDTYDEHHPVAHMIRTGYSWFSAWLFQKSTSLRRLRLFTRISAGRLTAISQGDRVSRAEIDARSLACHVSAGDIMKSMPDASLVIE
jgi:hypothetical protein